MFFPFRIPRLDLHHLRDGIFTRQRVLTVRAPHRLERDHHSHLVDRHHLPQRHGGSLPDLSIRVLLRRRCCLERFYSPLSREIPLHGRLKIGLDGVTPECNRGYETSSGE
jgi:hypothetical protein